MASDFWIEAFNKQEPLINIQKNWRCRIENIHVNFAPQLNITLGANSGIDMDTYKSMRLSKMHTIGNSVERAIQLFEKLEQFLDLTRKSHTIPVVRYIGMYSGLGSNWEKSNTGDLASLELDEKRLMSELIKAGCDVRILINLDVLKALAHGFTVDDVKKRVADICTVCDELKGYSNFSLAVDDFPSVDPVLSLDNVLMISNYNFDGLYGGHYRGGYNFSAWTSSLKSIEAFAARFDISFMKAVGQNRLMMDLMNIDSYSQLLYLYSSKRMENLT